MAKKFNPFTKTLDYLGSGEGGGDVSWAEITGKPTSSAADIDDAVAKRHDPTKITVHSSAGSYEEFDTLQEAFDSIPEATDSATRRIVWNVLVPGGNYDEALTIDCFRRSINVVCLGPVHIGLFANNTWEASNTRNIVLNHVASNSSLSEIDAIRDHISFVTHHIDDGMPAHHTAYRNGMRLSGSLSAVDDSGDAGSNLSVNLTHCRIFGSVDFTGHTKGHVRMTASNSFFNAVIGVDLDTHAGSWGFEIDQAYNCKFADNLICWRYGKFVDCRFYGTFKCNSAAFLATLEPCGFFNSYLVSTFTGPASSLRVDSATNYWLTQNSVTLAGGATKVVLDNNEKYNRSSVQFLIDGGGSEIATGIAGWIELPFAGTINEVRLFADQTGDIQIDIWKDSYANFPPTDADSITASAVPAISTGTKYEDTTLTGWTKAFSKGDILMFSVDSVSVMTKLLVSLTVSKT